jgi:hypothetical protein
VKYVLLFAVFAVIVLVAVGIGFVAGKNKASDYDKTKKAEYKEMSARVNTLVTERGEYANEAAQYRSALESIAAGRGGAPEITASSALAVARKD